MDGVGTVGHDLSCVDDVLRPGHRPHSASLTQIRLKMCLDISADPTKHTCRFCLEPVMQRDAWEQLVSRAYRMGADLDTQIRVRTLQRAAGSP